MEDEYINNKTREKRGFSKNRDGVYYKKSVLEKYYDLGYLSLFENKFSADDRLLAGKRIAFDYYMANRSNLQSVKQYIVNIRTTGESGKESQLFYKERYLRAIKAIPREFWVPIRFVCVDDNELKDNKNPKSSVIYKHNVYCLKALLCMGLDRLCEYYLKKMKKVLDIWDLL